MSHEIRTPLNGVLGMAQLLSRTRLDQQQHSYLNVLQASGQSLLDVIDDVLDISRIEAGVLELKSEVFDPVGLINDAISGVQGVARAKGLALKVNTGVDLPTYVAGDRARIKQLLLNLLGNAVKFTSQGEVRLDASWKAGRLRADVIDTGPGVPLVDRQLIFDRFAQSNSAASREHQGSGLGLAISREIARLAGGDVGIADTPEGQGAHFWIELPLAEVAVERDRSRFPAEVETGIEPIDLQDMTVLLVEDNAVNRQTINGYLDQAGCSVIEAGNGEEGLARLRDYHDTVSVIVLDLHMPVMSGREMLEAINAGAVGDDPPPVIVLTADAMVTTRDDMLACGARAVIAKPVDFNDLGRALQRIARPTNNMLALRSEAG